MSVTSTVTVDTSAAELELKQLENHAKISAQTVLTVTRKGYESIAILADMAGQSIPVYYSVLIEAVFVAAQAFITLAKAETITVWGAAKAVLTFSVAAMMYRQAVALRMNQQQSEGQLSKLIHLANIWVH